MVRTSSKACIKTSEQLFGLEYNRNHCTNKISLYMYVHVHVLFKIVIIRNRNLDFLKFLEILQVGYYIYCLLYR